MATVRAFPDFSEWLVGDRLAAEERAWAECKMYERNVSKIQNAFKLFDLKETSTVLELGCGTGWVPTLLSNSINYLGVDKNDGVLELARRKNSENRKFVKSDIRDIDTWRWNKADLVCSFAVLKHFGLHEWESVFKTILRFGKYGVFDIQTSVRESFDDGVEYHHSWVSDSVIEKCILEEGKTLASQETLYSDGRGCEKIFYVKEN